MAPQNVCPQARVRTTPNERQHRSRQRHGEHSMCAFHVYRAQPALPGSMGLAVTARVPRGARVPALAPFDDPNPSESSRMVCENRHNSTSAELVRNFQFLPPSPLPPSQKRYPVTAGSKGWTLFFPSAKKKWVVNRICQIYV